MWALGARALLLLLLLDAAGAQRDVCTVDQKVKAMKENTDPSNVVLAVITVPTDQEVHLTNESKKYFFIKNNELFLNNTPDYEVITHTVDLAIEDINDNPPKFSKETYTTSVPEDTEVNSIVISASDLKATDEDLSDVLFYELKEVTLGASKFFSLVSRTQPGLRLIHTLNYAELAQMTFTLLVRDTENENQKPSHTASATVVVDVLPADLRPPWFLPCQYNDSRICVPAQYEGIVPIDATPGVGVVCGVTEPFTVKFTPGPIYAVDGDWAINEKIIYSLQGESAENGMFSIDSDTGNVTMHRRGNPGPFPLWVTATQKSGARYSVTQVLVKVTSEKSNASFPLSLYRGFLVLGHGAGVAVKDTADPSQPLILRARDLFSAYNEDFVYRITDNENFKMSGEAVLTTSSLVNPGTYLAQVEAHNDVTKSSATTRVEIQVSPKPTPAPGTSQPGSTGPTSTVQMAALGGVLGALLLLALVALVVLVHKHYSHKFKCCCSRTRLKAKPEDYDKKAFVGDSEANWDEAPSPVTRSAGDKDPLPPPDPTPPESPKPAPLATPKPVPSTPPESASPTPPTSAPPSPPPLLRVADSPPPAVAQEPPEGSSPPAVRSILTKERRPEGGYKAVWFGEDIGAEADVVVLNTPTVGADGDSDGDGGGDSGGEDDGGDSNSVFV
ncbi:cadherin-related family member 5 [Sorex araneus]|uniref:cadherin-related family member 5 n=1 Tax=Sorex araneus TaxID=42254 RepID=UPI002433A06A|nr:cadherin-related family member 5 [Sorex araneus]